MNFLANRMCRWNDLDEIFPYVDASLGVTLHHITLYHEGVPCLARFRNLGEV